MKQKSALSNGFTLIELVIVVTVMIIISGAAIVNVISFNQRQSTDDDARTLLTEMRKVYAKATGVYYPNGCVGLTGYTVSTDINESSMTVTANCATSGAIVENVRDVLKMSKFSAVNTFTFMVPDGALSPISPQTVTIYNTNDVTSTKTIQIGSYGIFQLL